MVPLSSPGIALACGAYSNSVAGFFSQFGTVTNVRVSRNKKTGKAKHYAFLEFQYPDVAATAADAMHDYMLFTQKLVVRVVPEKVKTLPNAYAFAHRQTCYVKVHLGCIYSS